MRISHQEACSDTSYIASVGDIIFDSCGCEYQVFNGGRPWAMKKTVVCELHNTPELPNNEIRIKEIKLRLDEIDKIEGPRAVRERDLARGEIGFIDPIKYPQGRLRMLEDEAIALRAELSGLES